MKLECDETCGWASFCLANGSSGCSTCGTNLEFHEHIVDIGIGECLAKGIIYDSYNVECSYGKFSYIDPTDLENCESCIENLICYGGSRTTVKEGYWRRRAISLLIVECKNRDACL